MRARRFVEAQKADPGFAMAYWGEAMTYNHAVWQQTVAGPRQGSAGDAGADRGGAPAKAPTEKEKDWLAVGRAASTVPAKSWRATCAYADAMKRMYEKLSGRR